MNKFIVLACCLASLVSARPDVSLGYHYHPGYNSGANLLTAPLVSPNSYSPAPSGVSFDSGATSSSFLSPGYSLGGVQSGGAALGYTAGSSGNSVGSFGIGGGSIGIDSGFNTIGQGSGYNGVSQGFVGASGQFAQQFAPTFGPPIITKNFYVHSAPEEHDDQQIVRYVTIGQPQKNYRVLFINAPSSTSTKAKIIANVAPVEDRTAVYVLSKKTNELDISADVVTPPPTAPTKPDVFFIKYKTPEEAIHAQHVVQAQYDQLGGTTKFSNEGFVPVQSVIGSLGGQVSGGNTQGSSQIISQGAAIGGGSIVTGGLESGNYVSGGLLSSQSEIDSVNEGVVVGQTKYLPPVNKYKRY